MTAEAETRLTAQKLAVVELGGGQLRTAEEIQRILDAVATAVLGGRIDPYRGQTVASIYRVAADVKLKHDLERRLEELESLVRERQESWR